MSEPARAPAGLALFLAAPGTGLVAGRLESVLGRDRAARFGWECALLVMAKALRLRGCDVFVFVAPPDQQTATESRVMSRFGGFEGRFLVQRGRTQGERVNHALERLQTMGYGRQLVVGTDSPTMPQEYLQSGVDGLESADCIIGPTWAGNCYLIGVRHPDVRIFANVGWDSGLELEQIYANLSSLGLTCSMLPRWQNVDSADDLPFLEGQVRHADYRRLRAILEEPGGAG